MSAGSRNTEVIIERPVETVVAGVPIEMWEAVGTFWARSETRQPDQRTRFEIDSDLEQRVLRLDWLDAQPIAGTMRVRIGPKTFDIAWIDGDDDLKRETALHVRETNADPSRIKDEWREKMREGEIIKLVHDDFYAAQQTSSVRALVSGYRPEELVAGIDLGTRRVVAFADDVTGGAPKEGDTIILRDGTAEMKPLTIDSVDDSTLRVAGVLVCFIITASGR